MKRRLPPVFLAIGFFLIALSGCKCHAASVSTALRGSAPAPPDPTPYKMYLRIPGIPGSVTTKGFETSIQVMSVNHILSSDSNRRIRHSNIRVVKFMDKSSPLLIQAMRAANPIPTWELTLYRPAGGVFSSGALQAFYTIRLWNVRVIDFEIMENGNEEIDFNYERINWSWKDGGIEAEDTWMQFKQQAHSSSSHSSSHSLKHRVRHKDKGLVTAAAASAASTQPTPIPSQMPAMPAIHQQLEQMRLQQVLTQAQTPPNTKSLEAVANEEENQAAAIIANLGLRAASPIPF